MERGGTPVPLTDFQRALLATLAQGEEGESYLAGDAAIHFAPHSTRYSNDLDFFHDSVGRVAAALERDRGLLEKAGYRVSVEISQPGFIRAEVSRQGEATRVDWAHVSAWRFMPLVRDPQGGLLLDPVDLAVNKILALAGRDEPRDYVDILFIDQHVLPLGAACWAAAGKDPGFTPWSLLELLKRRGRVRPEEIARLAMTEPFDVIAAKEHWLSALDVAHRFVQGRPPAELGVPLLVNHGRTICDAGAGCANFGDAVAAFRSPGRGVATGERVTALHRRTAECRGTGFFNTKTGARGNCASRRIRAS